MDSGTGVSGSAWRGLIWSLWVAAFAAAIIFAPITAQAQSATGRILGNVHDQSGAAIVGATVTITDIQRGVSRTLTTDQAGDYLAPNLVAGMYEVKAEAKGFEAIDRRNIQLEVATDARIDFQLLPGEATQTVVVTAETPMLDSTSSTLGGTLSNQIINDLPLNGRNYENLLQLRPEVVSYPGGGLSTHSSNGVRPEDNMFFVDGLENVEPFTGQSIINGGTLAGDAATILPIDAIQEFNLQANPAAEYGWKPGAVVNVGLKSGTNSLHGTAYAFGRDDAFGARNYYNPVGTPQTPLSLQQFGTTVGGPIIRNKLFFFGAYEGQRYTVGNSYGISVPETLAQSTPDPKNSMPDAITGLATAGVPISPVSLKLAGCTLGPPVTCTGNVFGPNSTSSPNINSGFPNTQSGDNGMGKIDYQLNSRNTISGLYFFGNSTGTLADKQYVLPQYLTLLHTRAQVANVNWTSTPNSTWVNEVRFGYNRLYNPIFPVDQGTPATTYGVDTGVTNPLLGGLPSISLSGFTALGNGANHPKIIGPDQAFDLVDNISFLHGNHGFKFGGEVRKYTVDEGTFRAARGTIKFAKNAAFSGASPLEDFFAGLPSTGSIQVGDPTRHLHQWSYAGFFQDNWRVRSTVTLNLGLRYEFTSPPQDSQNLLGNFDPTLGLVQVGQQISSIYKPDHKNFSPRMGVAWDVFGDGKTILRAGGSIIYDTLPADVFISQQQTSNAPTLGLGVIPTGATIVQADGTAVPGTGTIASSAITVPGSQLNWNGTVFANANAVTCGNGLPATSPGTGTNPSPCSILGMNRNFTTPYVSTWTLNVQHAFTSNISTQVAYVGNHGSRLPGITGINQAALGSGWTPAAIAAGASDPLAEQASRPFVGAFPYLGFINYINGIYKSNYNGLQATITARNFHRLSFVGAYTYSHALDDSSENWNQYTPQDSTNPKAQYGNSDWDIRHRFTFSMTYSLPDKKSFAQLLEGWQVNTIVSLQTGAPWVVADTVDDISGTGEFQDRWDFFGNPSDFTSGAVPLPYFSGADIPAACTAKATTPGMLASLQNFGCYAKGNSVLIPPALGTFGTMGRNIFRDSGFHNVDFSIAKNWKFNERLTAQFRAEFFNIFNHPEFANPYGGPSDYGAGANDDPSSHNLFGCGCATPDVAAANPVLGSGGNRSVQLGLKLLF
ncbi:MAG: carboxypeptidase regulatory-like domain-containing protein [Candidatus Acidiferrales bacterium]